MLDSRQQTHMALTSLLDRAMKEAERRLEPASFLHSVAHSVYSVETTSTSSGITSAAAAAVEKGNHKDRNEVVRGYHTVKNRLLALSRVMPATCCGLRPSWWVMLALLVVDASVRHTLLHMNPTKEFDTKNNDHQIITTTPLGDQSIMDSSSSVWEQKLVFVVSECLGGNDLLRPGDLNSLRTFFFR